MYFWIFLIIPAFTFNSVFAVTQTKYVLRHSSGYRPLHVNDSIVLELTNRILKDSPGKYIHAAVSVVTNETNHLLVHFISLDIEFESTKPDRLHIFDYQTDGTQRKITPIQGLYGLYDNYYRHTSSGVKDYVSSYNRLRFDYMGRPSLLYSGFRILVTSFKVPNRGGECPYGYFKCKNKPLCIPITVVCDSYFNCGEDDSSDEKNCKITYTTGLEVADAITTAAVVAGVSITVFFLTIGVVACFLIRINRRNYMRRQSIQVVAKKTSNGKWTITNDLGLTTFYAPPTYEDVVRSEEDPPPAYDTLPRRTECSPLTENILNENNVTVVCIHNGDINDNSAVTCTHVQQNSACSGSENSDTSERDIACNDSFSMSECGSASGQSDSSIKKANLSDNSPIPSCSSKSSLPMDKICDKIEYLDSEGETEIM